MRNKIIKIVIAMIIVSTVGYLNRGQIFKNKNTTAYAVGDLTVDWGVASGNPIFVVVNMLPGDEETRTVKIKNSSTSIRPVGVRGLETPPKDIMPEALDFKITSNGNVYDNSLKNFFAESGGINGIYLFELAPGEERVVSFTAKFDESADNNYQGKSVVFDLIIGISFDVPSECKNIVFNGKAVFGTEGKDNLQGTPGNDLIVAFGGNDKVEGNSGEDCIIGGDGDDRLNGNNGNDVILGGDQDDEIYGNNGDDYLDGGAGKNKVYGNNGMDTCLGITGGRDKSCETITL